MQRLIATAPKMAACLLFLGWAAPALAGTPAEFFNEYDWAPTSPTPGPTNFEIIFAGDVTCQIPPQNQNNGSTNPFKNPNPITTTFNPATGNTTVMFSGRPLKPGQRYHFGLNQGYSPTPPLQIVGKMWTYDHAVPSPLPVVTVSPPPPASTKGPFRYAVVYLEASFSPTGQTYGSWYEVPYSVPKGIADAVTQPQMTFENFGTQPLYISNAGIQFGLSVPANPTCQTDPNCTQNVKLLNKLDFGRMPPPGRPGTKFVPIASPPPATLQPKAVAVAIACPISKTTTDTPVP